MAAPALGQLSLKLVTETCRPVMLGNSTIRPLADPTCLPLAPVLVSGSHTRGLLEMKGCGSVVASRGSTGPYREEPRTLTLGDARNSPGHRKLSTASLSYD